jgi:hypothetical protein
VKRKQLRKAADEIRSLPDTTLIEMYRLAHRQKAAEIYGWYKRQQELAATLCADETKPQ